MLAAAGVFACHLQTRTAPAIAVSIRDETGGGTNYLPAINGYTSGHGGATQHESGKEIYNADMTFKVISTSEGHFAVLSHYVIERDGVLTTVDRILPVSGSRPDKSQWSKLDGHLAAYAYMSKTTLNY